MQRDIAWITSARVVGVSRTHEGRLEIFLAGSELVTSSRTVKEAVEHQTWHRKDETTPLEANRLLLPAIGHFDQVAAFICTELLRAGADQDLDRAFKQVEPIIEIAIKRLRVSDQALEGLTGELLLLNALCQRASDDHLRSILESWQGWRESRRDFALGELGVEVKTTTRTSSSHQVQGTHQVELDDGEDGGPGERLLMLVSLGVQPGMPGDDSFTMPRLVERVIERIEASGHSDLVTTFLFHVREYGATSGLGYDHETMSQDVVFARPLTLRFARGYDMTDEAIEVIRRADVANRQHVDLRSLTYRVDLPNTVSGDLNPIVGLHQLATKILDMALPSSLL